MTQPASDAAATPLDDSAFQPPAPAPAAPPPVAASVVEPASEPVPVPAPPVVAAAPTPVAVVEAPAPAAPPPSTEVAVPTSTELVTPTMEDDWAHETVEYLGEKLAVRVPTQQAITALSLGTGKFVKDETRQNMTSMFVARHLSQVTYEHVFSRLMDPDDTDYTVDTVGELMRLLIDLAVDRIKAVLEAGNKPALNGAAQ